MIGSAPVQQLIVVLLYSIHKKNYSEYKKNYNEHKNTYNALKNLQRTQK